MCVAGWLAGWLAGMAVWTDRYMNGNSYPRLELDLNIKYPALPLS